MGLTLILVFILLAGVFLISRNSQNKNNSVQTVKGTTQGENVVINTGSNPLESIVSNGIVDDAELVLINETLFKPTKPIIPFDINFVDDAKVYNARENIGIAKVRIL